MTYVQSPPDPAHTRIAIIGLGYVGLPLAVEFGKQYDTVGFDINEARIAELRAGRDSTLEVEPELLAEVYIDLIGARQSQLILASEASDARAGSHSDAPRRQREIPLVARVSEVDREAHRAFVATLGDKPIWNDYLPPPAAAEAPAA